MLIFSNILNLIIFQITNMISVKRDRLVIYLTSLMSCLLFFLRGIRKTFIVALDISKDFARVLHKTLLAKLPSYGFTPL